MKNWNILINNDKLVPARDYQERAADEFVLSGKDRQYVNKNDGYKFTLETALL